MRARRTNGIQVLALAAAAAVVTQTPTSAAARTVSEAASNAHGCWYYGDTNFQGARAKIVGGEAMNSLDEQWNDKISSLTCHPLCSMNAYEGADQTGRQKRFSGDVRSVGAEWNDRISSMSVSCRKRMRSVG